MTSSLIGFIITGGLCALTGVTYLGYLLGRSVERDTRNVGGI